MTRGVMHVGTVGGGPPATVDPVGTVVVPGAGWTCEWWIGGDDRWHVPANEVAVRQQRLDDSAVVETSMRVPGGDAVQRVYAVGGVGNPVVVEVENRSPAPFVVAFSVRGASNVEVAGTHARVDRAFVLSWTRAPSRWAHTVGAPVLLPVSTGRAETGPFPPMRDRGGRIEAAFLHPVAHRTTLRMVVARGKDPAAIVDVRAVPDASAAMTGWARHVERGMQVDLPDDALVHRLRAARVEVILRAQASRPDPVVMAALEDWGADAEAAESWQRLGTRDRRRATQRPALSTWADVRRIDDDAALLVAARRLLVADPDRGGGPVVLCADFPDAWRGHALEVQRAPIPAGTVSYAVRWHGNRPALLWEAPDEIQLRAPGLDPDWCSDAPRGEALLSPVPGGRALS